MPLRVKETAAFAAAFNTALAAALRRCRAAWGDAGALVAEGAEAADVAEGAEKSRPGQTGRVAVVLVQPPLISPVIIACAADRRAADAEAIRRLGARAADGTAVLTTFALRIPQELQHCAGGREMRQWLEQPANTLEYALYSLNEAATGAANSAAKPAAGYAVRFPPLPSPEAKGEQRRGAMRGNVRELSDMIEIAALPAAVVAKAASEAADDVRAAAQALEGQLPRAQQEAMAAALGQPPGGEALKVAACVWLNAMTLPGAEAGAGAQALIRAWQNLPGGAGRRALAAAASQSLLAAAGGAPQQTDAAVKKLAAAGEKLRALRLGELGDIGAEMYPRLAADRKATAAFYTKPAAAELLAVLAVKKLMRGDGGGDGAAAARAGAGYNIADFACGSGTLLKSAYRSIRREVQKQGGGKVDAAAMAALHKAYMENYIHGADIQSVAVQLTVAGLAAVAPAAAFERCKILLTSIADGGAGALEWLSDRPAGRLGESPAGGDGAGGEENAPPVFIPADGSMDLCILNPPYTGARGGHRLFDVSGISERARQKSVARLNALSRTTPFAAAKAGLGAVFSGLAHNKLKEGGIFAFVLPLSAASQGSWRKWRAQMVKHYSEILVISAPQSLSADTGMREMMICARKKQRGRQAADGEVTQVNLCAAPRSMAEAHAIAGALSELSELPPHKNSAMLETAGALSGAVVGAAGGALSHELRIGGHVVATYTRILPQPGAAWGGAGAASAAAAAGSDMNSGVVCVPGGARAPRVYPLPLATEPLHGHCAVGLTHNQIGHIDGCDTIGAYTFYPYPPHKNSDGGDDGGGSAAQSPLLSPELSLWAADCKAQKRLQCAPTHYGVLYANRVQTAARADEKKARLFIARGLRLTSQAAAAALTPEKCHGGRAWAALLCEARAAAAYCLWLNSIFGLIARWYCSGKQHAGRAQMQIQDIKNFPCPNFSAASGGDEAAAKHARRTAEREMQTLRQNTLQPCAYAWRDDNRKKIDRAAARMLRLDIGEDEMQALREIWCADSTVHGGKRDIVRLLQQDGLAG